jgi:DNA-binding protein HU-beta
MTKTEVIARLAEKTGLPKTQVGAFLDELAGLAYAEAKNTFLLPGIGKLVLVTRKARVGRNPATGETIQIPEKKVVKFRVAKACKEAILGN